jgi:tetratricopeptide (TPR) repeat protein
MKKSPALIIFLVLCHLVLSAGASSATDKEFHDWLAGYEAWDVLERSMAATEQHPQLVLDRADNMLKMDRSEQAVSLLLSSGEFSTHPALEIQRRWLLGRLSRQTGNSALALEFFSSVRKLSDEDAFTQLAAAEPGLNTFFQLSWLSLFWNEDLQNFPGKRSELLRDSLTTARILWREDPFWSAVEQTYFGSGVPEATRFEPLLIMDHSQVRTSIIRSLALWSMQRFDQASENLKKIQQSEVRQFWTTFGEFLKNGMVPDDSSKQAHFPKIDTFWTLGEVDNIPRELWFTPAPAGRYWSGYLEELAAMDLNQVRTRLQEDIDAPLLFPEDRHSLSLLALGLALAEGDVSHAVQTMPQELQLPLTLVLALSIATPGQELVTNQPASIREPLLLLASAAGVEIGRPGKTTWLQMDPAMLGWAVSLLPLDRELAFLYWSRELHTEFNAETAKRVAFLFSNSDAGMNALLALARSAQEKGEVSLAFAYLQRIDPGRLGADNMAGYLESKAGLLMGSGKESEALQLYKALFESHQHRLSPGTLLKLVEAAQRHKEWELGGLVLDELRSQRQGLAPEVQAEIRFRTAEMAEYRGQTDEALHAYLELAWAAPELNWGKAALYRSALLYEGKGWLETARRLLEEVITLSEEQGRKEKASELRQEIVSRIDGNSPGRKTVAYPF